MLVEIIFHYFFVLPVNILRNNHSYLSPEQSYQTRLFISFLAHKKTKVIKTHMLQKPLPRSTETCRPRNMIFKISVHQNDTSGENGHNNNGSSHTVKTREYIQIIELLFKITKHIMSVSEFIN